MEHPLPKSHQTTSDVMCNLSRGTAAFLFPVARALGHVSERSVGSGTLECGVSHRRRHGQQPSALPQKCEMRRQPRPRCALACEPHQHEESRRARKT